MVRHARNGATTAFYGVDVADDPDALWKPGADRDVGFVRPEPRPFVVPDATDERNPAANGAHRSDVGDPLESTHPSGRRWTAAVVVVAMVVGAGLVVALGDTPTGRVADPVPPAPIPAPAPIVRDVGGDVINDDVPLPAGAFASECSDVRLPSSVEERWSISIDDVWDIAGSLVAGSGGVAALSVDTPEPDATYTLRMFESVDGSERWRSPVDDIGIGRGPVAVVAGVVIVEGSAEASAAGSVAGSAAGTGDDDLDATVLTAFDARTGAVAWTQTIEAGMAYLIDRVSESVVVEYPGPGVGEIGDVLVLDAAGGIVTGNVGRFVALDPDRRLVTRAGDKFLVTSGTDSTSTLLGVALEPGAPAAAVGAGVLVDDGAPGTLRFLDYGPDGERVERPVRLVGSPRIDPPSDIASLSALGESTVVVTGRGAVHGAVLDDDELSVRWRVDGLLVATAPSDRGSTLLVSSDGGALQRLVDASTGRKFFDAPTIGGAVDADDLFANGVVVPGGTGTAAFRNAYDLDGDFMWRLPRWGALAVGDRVVYDTRRAVGTAAEPPSVNVSVVAFGPIPTEASECDQRELGEVGDVGELGDLAAIDP